MLNQANDVARNDILQKIADEGASTERLLSLNEYNICPTSLLALVENRDIELVCVNYVHLLPVVEMLGLLGRRGTRVVLETHDIQANQHAARLGKSIDIEDRELEAARFSDVDAVVAISLSEYNEIRELNPWANVQLVLPTVQPRRLIWDPVPLLWLRIG